MTLVSAENEAGQGCQRRTKESSATAQSTTVLQIPMYRSSKKNCSTIQHLEIQK